MLHEMCFCHGNPVLLMKIAVGAVFIVGDFRNGGAVENTNAARFPRCRPRGIPTAVDDKIRAFFGMLCVKQNGNIL